MTKTLLEQAHEAGTIAYYAAAAHALDASAPPEHGGAISAYRDAFLSFLLSQGYKILGPEPTEGMSIAGQLVPMGIGGSPPSWQRIWDAMHAAAPSFPEGPSPDEEEMVERVLPKPAYVMSEPHLSGWRVVVGYEALGDAQAAQSVIMQMGRQK